MRTNAAVVTYRICSILVRSKHLWVCDCDAGHGVEPIEQGNMRFWYGEGGFDGAGLADKVVIDWVVGKFKDFAVCDGCNLAPGGVRFPAEAKISTAKFSEWVVYVEKVGVGGPISQRLGIRQSKQSGGRTRTNQCQ